MNATAITIVCYLVLVPLLGVVLNRRVSSAASWATAGGGLGIVMIAAGVAGTRIGGAGTYGVAGAVMNTGLWNIWYGVTTFLALALVGLFFTRPYRRLQLNTIAELFQQRYGTTRCGWLTSLCVQTEYLVVNVIEPLLIGIIVSNVLGVSLLAGIAVGSAVIILATSLSGLRGTSFTNVIHCSVIIAGLAAVAVIGAQQMGGWNQVVNQATANLQAADQDAARWWSLAGLGVFPIIAMFFSATIHTPAASVYVNFSSSARSERILVPAFLIAGVLAAGMSILSALIGVEALGKYGVDSGIAGYTSVTRIAMDTGPLIGGVATAAVLAALISSGGPILLAGSTMLVNDWIPGSPAFSHVKKLRAYRVTSVIYGIVAGLIACYFGYVVGAASVLQWLLLGYAMVVPPAIAIANIFYLKGTTETAVFWGIGTGYGLGLVTWILDKQLWHFEHDVTAYVTTLVPLVVIPGVSYLTHLTGPGASAVMRGQALLGWALTALLALAAWLLNLYLGLVSNLVCALSVSLLPLWLFPTQWLFRHAQQAVGERAQSFYQRMQTPL